MTRPGPGQAGGAGPLLLPPGPSASPLLALPAPLSPVLPCGRPAPPAYLPCDAAFLKLEHDPKHKDEGRYQSVECTVPAARDPSLSAAQRRLLAGADLLLQTLAESLDDAGDVKPSDDLNHARIAVSARLQPDCSNGRHKTVALMRNGVKSDAPLGRSGPMALLARSGRDTGSAVIRGNTILREIWAATAGRRTILAVTLDSCGVNPGKPPVSRLTGRVEVIARNEWEVRFKVPPLYKETRERERYRDLARGDRVVRTFEATENRYSGKGQSIDRKDIVNRARGTDYREWEGKAGLGSAARGYAKELGVKDGAEHFEKASTAVRDPKYRKVADALGHRKREYDDNDRTFADYFEVEPTVSIRRNGRDVVDTEWLNGILKVAAGVKSALDDLQKFVPKWGLYMTFSLSVLEGEMSIAIGQRTRQAPDHPRLWLVEDKLKLTFAVTLIAMDYRLAFGLNVQTGPKFWPSLCLTLILEAFVNIAGSIALEAELSTVPTEERSNPIKGTITAKGGAKGVANALGFRFDSEASLTCGIDVDARFTSAPGGAGVHIDEARLRVFFTVRCDSAWHTRPVERVWPDDRMYRDGFPILNDVEVLWVGQVGPVVRRAGGGPQ